MLDSDEAIEEAFSMVPDTCFVTLLDFDAFFVRDVRSSSEKDVRADITDEELDSFTRFFDPEISPFA